MNCQSRNNASHCVHGSIWCLGRSTGNKWRKSVLLADATTSQYPETRPFVCSFSRKRPLAESIKIKGKAFSFSFLDMIMEISKIIWTYSSFHLALNHWLCGHVESTEGHAIFLNRLKSNKFKENWRLVFPSLSCMPCSGRSDTFLSIKTNIKT